MTVPSLDPEPPAGDPPSFSAAKGKPKADKRGRVAVGEISCSAGPCVVKAKPAKLKLKKKTYEAKLTKAEITDANGASAQLEQKLKLRPGKGGKGK